MNVARDRRALIVGATGLVGSELLTALSRHESYSAVATLGRHSPALRHEHVTHRITDFAADWTKNPEPFADVDVLFCCLGTTIKRAGSQKAFRAIDCELVTSIAGQALENGIGSFLVVSSVGADPDSGNFYLRTKGEMERAIARTGFRRAGIVRPSLLLGVREDLRPAEQLGQYAARLLSPLLAGGLARYRAVSAATVAAAMIGLDQADYEGIRIIEGNEIRRLAGT